MRYSFCWRPGVSASQRSTQIFCRRARAHIHLPRNLYTKAHPITPSIAHMHKLNTALPLSALPSPLQGRAHPSPRPSLHSCSVTVRASPRASASPRVTSTLGSTEHLRVKQGWGGDGAGSTQHQRLQQGRGREGLNETAHGGCLSLWNTSTRKRAPPNQYPEAAWTWHVNQDLCASYSCLLHSAPVLGGVDPFGACAQARQTATRAAT